MRRKQKCRVSGAANGKRRGNRCTGYRSTPPPGDTSAAPGRAPRQGPRPPGSRGLHGEAVAEGPGQAGPSRKGSGAARGGEGEVPGGAAGTARGEEVVGGGVGRPVPAPLPYSLPAAPGHAEQEVAADAPRPTGCVVPAPPSLPRVAPPPPRGWPRPRPRGGGATRGGEAGPPAGGGATGRWQQETEERLNWGLLQGRTV